MVSKENVLKDTNETSKSKVKRMEDIYILKVKGYGVVQQVSVCDFPPLCSPPSLVSKRIEITVVNLHLWAVVII